MEQRWPSPAKATGIMKRNPVLRSMTLLPLVPEAAKVSDPFCSTILMKKRWPLPFMVLARVLAVELFPDPLTVTRSQTFTAYERLSHGPDGCSGLRRPTVM